jgi:hypothetical protein
MPNIVVWSHSALKDYESCAKKYQEVRVLKNYQFTETEATRYGTQLHLAAEEFIRAVSLCQNSSHSSKIRWTH